MKINWKYKDSQMITNKLTIEVIRVWITVIEEENKLILFDKITLLELQNSKREISFQLLNSRLIFTWGMSPSNFLQKKFNKASLYLINLRL